MPPVAATGGMPSATWRINYCRIVAFRSAKAVAVEHNRQDAGRDQKASGSTTHRSLQALDVGFVMVLGNHPIRARSLATRRRPRR